jgi:hypothetical protein
VRTREIVEALPLVELGVEELGVVNDLTGEQPIELFVIDAMRPLEAGIRMNWLARPRYGSRRDIATNNFG